MLSPFCVATCLSLAAGPAHGDQPKPNTLTPKEVAEGWLLLFDGETTFGWSPRQVVDKKYWEFTAKDGALVLEGKMGGYAEIGCTSPFRHFELVGEYKVKGEVQPPWAGLGIDLVHTEPSVGNHFPVTLPETAEWRPFTVRLAPDAQSATVGGKVVHQWKAPTGADKGRFVPVKLLSSRIRFFAPERGDVRLELRNLKLRPLALAPLFNGKDLSGWKVFQGEPKRKASKFEVTKEGELSVKNGPGDLQTEKQFDNFVLQIDCKTNGKGLNSGVFFRCVPGQYQNGYEAQIHNGYKDNDRTKPVDFGTGAIYRRVPARKVVSNDQEWFTLTVVANGPHIATWVNGYQTVDWTDERKPAQNPRQGLRTARGHLSLQGHDPRTDLLFRNLRLAELPAEKKEN
jgi:hypothetical protein